MSSANYSVYLGVYSGTAMDHHAIWISTGATKQLGPGKPTAAGVLVQVTGSIQKGMDFEVKDAVDPITSLTGKEKIKIGTIRQNDLQRLIEVCQTLPPPSKQFNGPKRIDSSKPLYRCQDWTAEAAQLLIDAGVLRKDAA